MSDDLLITPGSRKLEIKDSSGNVDAKIETDASGNLAITNAGGDISIGDTSSDIFVGDGTNNVDIVFEQDGEIRGTSGVTLTLGASGSNVRMASDLNLNGNDITGAGDITLTGNLNVTGNINSTSVTDLDVTDKTITLGVGQNEASSGGSGIVIAGSNAELKWNESNDRFEMNKGLSVSAIVGNGAGLSNLDAGQLTGTVAPARLNQPTSGNWWSGGATIVQTDGVMEIGKHIDFHNTDTTTADFDVRLQVHSTNNLSISGNGRILTTADEGSGNGLDADKLDNQDGSYYLNRANHTGTLSIGTTSPFQIEGGSANWSETVQGGGTGSLHLDPGVGTADPGNNFGSAITFGASDTSSGDNAQAGIYVRSDGAYGTKMYFSTTNSYASGSKTFMYADHNGKIFMTRAGGLDVVGPVSLDSALSFSNATATNMLDLNNNNIIGVNAIQIADPGPNEGVSWSNIKIFESPNDLTTNSAGNFQVSYGGTRRFTVDSTGAIVNGRLEVEGTGQFKGDGAVGPNALNLLGVNNGNGVGITFSDNGTPANAGSGQRGNILYYHGDGASYGSGNAFVFDSTETSLTVLTKGKLMTSGGLWRAPSSGTGAGTQMISSTGAVSNITSLSASGDADFGGYVEGGNVRMGAGNSSSSIFRTASGMAGLHFTTNAIYPTNNSGAVNDATVDIGGASNRFKDIHLSGEMSAASGHTSGKFAVMSSAPHGSFDFYNNGTSYFNGAVTVDDALNLSGGNRALKVDGVTVIDANREGKFSGGLVTSSTRADSGYCHPVGHYTTGEEVFSIDPTWTSDQLAEFFDATTTEVNWFADSTAPDGYAIRVQGAVSVGPNYGSGFPYISVGDVGDEFYMECYIRNHDSNQTHYMGGIEKDESFGTPDSGSGNPGSFGYWVMLDTNPGTSWTKVSGYIKNTGGSNTTGEFETGANYFVPMALFNYTSGAGTRTCYISGWKCFKVTRPGGIHVKTTSDSRPAIKAENTGGINGIIQEWIGDSDKMQMFNESGGDYFLRNNQQNNGIFFADGSGGVSLRYAGNDVLKVDSTGGVKVNTGSLKMGPDTVINSNRDYIGRNGTFTSYVETGSGSGGVALTINDGYGNANVTFNHRNGEPEQNGQAARIEVNTDGTSTSGNMAFELSSSDVTANTAVSLTSAMTLHPTRLEIPNELSHMGDTDTLMRFSGANQILHIVGGVHTCFMDSSLMTINPNGGNYDFRVEGDTDVNLIYADASADKVGIGRSDPTNKLQVVGDARVEGNFMSGAASATNVPARAVHIKSSGSNAALRIEDTTSSNQIWDLRSTHGTGLLFIDETAGATRLTIDTSGNVVVAGALTATSLNSTSGDISLNGEKFVRQKTYSGTGNIGASGSYYNLGFITESNTPTYITLKMAAHSTQTFVVTTGYHGSNVAHVQMLSSTWTPNGGYPHVAAVRILKDASSNYRFQVKLTYSSGPVGFTLDARAFGATDAADVFSFQSSLTVDSTTGTTIEEIETSFTGTSNSGQNRSDYGSSSTPSYTFKEDGDTGMYRVSANNIGLTAGGTERLRIGSDVFIRGATDFNIAGSNRRVNFTSGTGTVRTTTGNSLILATNNTTALTLDTSQNATFAGTINSGAITASGDSAVGGSTNISMSAASAGQLRVFGAGYTGSIALDANAMHIYHNSSSRDLILGTNETARLNISGSGTFDFQNNTLQSIGEINIDENLRHSGDANTRIQFLGDKVRIHAGGVEMIDCQENGAGTATFVDIVDRVRVERDGDLLAEGDVVAFTSTSISDRKLKENIKPIKNSVEKVMALGGVTYNWKKNGESSVGVIAQDVEEVLPEVVKEKEGRDGEEFKTVNYDGLVGLLIEGMKEQQNLINRLEERIKDLENNGE